MANIEGSPVSLLELSSLAVDLAQRFVQRWDIYARQLEDGRYICIHEPLQTSHLHDHLNEQITLGIYILDERSQARFLVYDADNNQRFSDLTWLSQKLASEDIPTYLETSRRGGHLWLFFPLPIPGYTVRDFGRQLLLAHKIEGIELFPKQDQLAGGPGSLIRMPFGLHRITGQRYGFVTPQGEPLAPTFRKQIQILSSPKTVPEAAFLTYRPQVSSKPILAVFEGSEQSRRMLSERIKTSVTVLEFVSQYVDLKPTNNGGVGICPFHDDQRPSLSVNDQGNYWHCFAGCGGGSVIDFWMRWHDCEFTIAIAELAHMLL